MKKTLLLLSMLVAFASTAQVTNEGQPLSWKVANDHSKILTKQLPSFDLETIKAEDAINDPKFEKPWRFGYMHSVDYGFNDGQWTILENGDRIWRLAVESKGALSINFIFDDFYMPEGGFMYLYSDDRKDLLGAYTAIQNQDSGILGTWLVKGEKVWIEYYEPASVKGEGRLHIAKATHGYRDAASYYEAKGLNDSGNCNLDVDCPIGDDYEQIKEHNKRAVGILLSGGSGFCSGALINNTNNDGTPYFLTANHCYSNPAGWSFRFGWISPNPVCAESTNSDNGPTTQTISGATLRARSANADFCLVEINNDIPADWNRVFAGWDRSDDIPDFTVGIHHPSGDIMKVCRDDDAPTKEVNAGAQTWEILGGSGQGWELGVTEPGSSGSPLFDPQGRIVGQLYGGGAACSGTNDNGALDYYGRFGVSWDTGSSVATRLEDWLDPAGTNPTVLNANPPLEVFALDGALSVTFGEVICGDTKANPVIRLTNFGENNITAAVIEWQLNSGAVETINFNGNLEQNETESFVLDNFTIEEGTEYTINAEITEINGNSDDNGGNDNAEATLEITGGDEYATEQVTLELLTDDYAEETTWEFRTASGTVIDSGGPYQQGSDDNTLFTEVFELDLNECYIFELFDEFGDGICCEYGIGSYSLTTEEGEVIFEGGEFGASEVTEFRTPASLSVNDTALQGITLYPNPTNNDITINLREFISPYTYKMVNVLGQEVQVGNLSDQTTNLNVSGFKSGIYFLTIMDATNASETTLKFIKK